MGFLIATCKSETAKKEHQSMFFSLALQKMQRKGPARLEMK